MDHVDADREVAPRAPLTEALWPIARLEGADELPRALFIEEVLARGACAVAIVDAEREGEELKLEQIEALGEVRQATLDRRGLREVLLHTRRAVPVLLRRRRSAVEISAADAGVVAARELAESLAAAIRVKRRPRDTRVAVAFWSGPGGDVFSSPGPRWRRLALPRFAEIEDNYPLAVRRRLTEFNSHPSGASLAGRLALWHGPPGTGKTWALRALGREWNAWCDLHYIADPERLLGGDTSYMLETLAARSEPLDSDDDDDDDDETFAAGDREAGERWRLLVIEDAGELLGVAAPAEIGRGFSRLLNIVDGLLGQGSRALILVTTNEPLGKLHPAALRPGRAMATLEFAPLTASEASAWLAERDLKRRIDTPKTIAELHAIVRGAMSSGDPEIAWPIHGVPEGCSLFRSRQTWTPAPPGRSRHP